MADPGAAEFTLPDLGEGLTDAEIVSWHVAAGDHVVADQPLLTVETDKAVVDIPAPHAGRIAALHAAVGDRVAVGELLVTYAAEGEAAAATDRGAVVGELEEHPAAEAPPPEAETRAHPERTGGVRISPKARRQAERLGVDISRLKGSGPEGTVQLGDVQAAAGQVTGEPLRGVRRAMAERMADAQNRVARASVTGEADISAWPDGTRPMPRLVRAVAAACLAEPGLNAHFDDGAMTLTPQPTVNLGIAMETADGLFVPVLNDVNGSSGDALAEELERLQQAVAERTVRPAELKGQTITLSNFGAVAGLHAEMIVVPPQVAIVGAGRTFDRAGKGGVGQRILPLSISFDHRVVTGVEACRFLLSLTEDLEHES